MKKIIIISFYMFFVGNLFSQSPGNVGLVNLTAWFKPDLLPLGNVNSWTTTYPTGAGSLTVTDNVTPFPLATNTPLNNVSNYNMTIEFTGNSLANLKALTNTTSLNLLDNSTSSSQGTFFGVYYLPAATPNNHMMLYNETGNDAIQFRNLGANGRLAIGRTLGTSLSACRNWVENNLPTIISYKGNRSGSATMIANENSKLFTTSSASQSSGATGLHFGIMPGNTNSPFNGYLNEFIFYNRNLTLLEMNKIHTYLAVKYGITLNNLGGGAQGDYIATNGTIIWDASLFGNYHNNVIGIGKENNESLHQKQSHTFDDISRIYINSLSTTNAANLGTITNDSSYVMMGNDNGVMCPTATSNIEVPVSTLVSTRLEREWKITKTNFPQTFSCDFTLGACATPSNFNLNCLVLLVDDDGNFTNSSVYDASSGIGFTVSGNVLTISGLTNSIIPNNSTKFITVGSITLEKNFGNDTTICTGDSVLLDAGNIGATYLWQNGSVNQKLNVKTPGVYSVIISFNGCDIYDTIVVSNQKVTTLFRGSNLTGCIPFESAFTDLSTVNIGSITGWNWSFGDGNTSNLQNPFNTFVIGGTFDVKLSVTTNLGCKNSLLMSSYVIANSFAVAEFNFNPILSKPQETINFFDLSSNTSSWSWYFGDGDSSSVQNPTHAFTNKGTYIVTLIARNINGCNDTVEHQITVKDEIFFAPNTFTPNNDGTNETWQIVGLNEVESFELLIFNRWGEIIFESNDISKSWDGKHEGIFVEQGEYSWKMNINYDGSNIKEYYGHINLLR